MMGFEDFLLDIDKQREIVVCLKNPKAFPHKVNYIKLKETPLSWIIMTGLYVYKIRK